MRHNLCYALGKQPLCLGIVSRFSGVTSLEAMGLTGQLHGNVRLGVHNLNLVSVLERHA